MDTRFRPSRVLILALLIGLVVRAAAFWFVEASPNIGDQIEYAFRSTALLEGREVPGEAKRPPAIIWFFAAVGWVTRGGDPRIANLLLGCASIALVWQLGRRFGGARTAAVAAFATALYPVFALYDVSLWSEPFYIAVTLATLLLVSPPGARPGTPAVLGAGVLCAIAALTREVGLMMPVLAAAWLVYAGGWKSPRAWRSAGLLLGAFTLVLLPWTVHQTRAHGTFVLVSRTNGLNLFMGNALLADGEGGGEGEIGRRSGNGRLYRAYDRLGKTRAQRETVARERALHDIRARMPAWPVEKVLEMVPDLLTPAPLPVGRLVQRADAETNIRRWAYVTPVDGTSLEWIREALAYTIVACWIAVVLSGTWGLALSRSPLIGLFYLYIALHVLPVIVTYGGSRYRLPIVPLLIVAAAWALAPGGAAWKTAGVRRRLIAVVVTLLVAAAVASEWAALVDPRWA